MVFRDALIPIIIVVTFGCNKPKQNIWISQNPSDFVRLDEPVVILDNEIDNKEEGKLISVVKLSTGEYLPSQADDLDGDGKWDELAFLCSFKPQEKIEVIIEFIPTDQAPVFRTKTNIMMGVSRNRDSTYVEVSHEEKDPANKPMDYPPVYQMEGPAWENDKVAFRTYFDDRNGKDIFGKLTEDMVLQNVGATSESYHELYPWGMDVLKVDTSLGASSLAILDGDSLIRLGATKSAGFDIITEGPVRSILQLDYSGWDVNDTLVRLTEQITIWAGQYWYKSQVTLSGIDNDMNLIAGMVNFHADSLIELENSGCQILATHDQQSENKDMLGMSIIIRNDNFIGSETIPQRDKDISDTFIGKILVSDGVPVSYYFVAGWEKSNPDFAKREGFLDLLKYYANSFNSPIVATYAGNN